jgi:hypothetical protein
MEDPKRTTPPVHFVRTIEGRENIATFSGQVPREGDVVWMDPDEGGPNMQYRVVTVEWQIVERVEMNARVYVEPVIKR